MSLARSNLPSKFLIIKPKRLRSDGSDVRDKFPFNNEINFSPSFMPRSKTSAARGDIDS
jgi:hypothetical protein